MADQRVVLISGASSGVGRATAGLLAHRGYTVFGTSRNPAGAASTAGVEMLAYACDLSLDEIVVSRAVPIVG